MSNELIVIEQSSAVAVLSTDDGIKTLLDNVRANIANMDGGSMKNKSSRAKIRSNAFKATKAFAKINDETIIPLMASLTKEIQPQLDIINAVKANQSVLKTGLQQIRKEVNTEVDAFEAEIKRIEDEKQFNADLDAAYEINAQFDENRKLEIESDHEVGLLMNEKHDRDIADLVAKNAENERLRIEQEEKAREIREANIAKEAKERAERESLARENQLKIDALAAQEREKKAEAEKVAAQNLTIAQAKQAEIDKAEEAKRQAQAAKDAEQKRLADIEEAKQQEIQRQEMAKKQAELDRLKNEANEKHSAKIHNEMMQAIVAAGFEAGIAKAMVILLKENKIPHVGKVQY